MWSAVVEMGLAYIGLTGVGREFVCAGPLFGRGLYLKTGRVSFMQVGSALCLLAGGGSALANREQLLAGRIKVCTGRQVGVCTCR